MEESHVDHVANEGAADETVQESTSEPATISVSEPARVLQSSPERTVLADHGQPNQLFEQLQGPDGLIAVTRRFTQSVDVLRYALEFYMKLAEIEDMYATAISKLLRSPCYTFKQNFLRQLMRNGDIEEFGSLNAGWKKLGGELQRVSNHHREQAANIRGSVREPLESCLSGLEESKSELISQSKVMIHDLSSSEKQLATEKKHYMKLSEEAEKLRAQKAKLEKDVFSNTSAVSKLEKTQSLLTQASQVAYSQERIYYAAVDSYVKMQSQFEKKGAELMKKIGMTEINRVHAMKRSFKELARVLSNSGPTYLEGMKRTLLFTDSIDAMQDMQMYVDGQPKLKERMKRPKFEAFQSQFEAPLKVETLVEGDQGTPPPQPPPIPKKPSRPKRDHAAEFFGTHGHGQIPPSPAATSQPVSTTAPSIQQTMQDVDLADSDDNPSSPVFNPFDDHTIQPQPEENGEHAQVGNSQEEKHEGKTVDEEVDSEAWIDNDESTFDELVASTANHQEDGPVHATAKARSQGDADDILVSISSFKKRKPATLPKPPVKPVVRPKVAKGKAPPKSTTPDGLLDSLLELSKKNDYYGLLGASQTADKNELAKLRRQRTAALHPDHFTKNESARQQATAKLALLNQVYTDVLVKEKPRALYDQLVAFRKSYGEIPTQSGDGLAHAIKRFQELRTNLERAHVPDDLVKEMNLAIQTAQAHEQTQRTK